MDLLLCDDTLTDLVVARMIAAGVEVVTGRTAK